jgi:hypothetical protein
MKSAVDSKVGAQNSLKKCDRIPYPYAIYAQMKKMVLTQYTWAAGGIASKTQSACWNGLLSGHKQ